MTGQLAVILVASVAGANPWLDEGRKHYEALRYSAAEAQLRLAVSVPTATAEELHEACDLLARALAAQGRLDEARTVYADLLVKAPHAEGPQDASPKIRALFEDAKRRLYPANYVRLKVLPAPAGRVRAALVDPWAQVDQVRMVATDVEGVRPIASSPAAAEVTLEVAPPPGAALSLQAVAGDGGVLASAPLALAPVNLVPVQVAAEPPAQAAPIWPVWAGGGAAVASAAGGVALLALAENDYAQAGSARRAVDIRELDASYRQKAVAGQVLLGVSTLATAATVYLLLR